jgi:hypothetical protein
MQYVNIKLTKDDIDTIKYADSDTLYALIDDIIDQAENNEWHYEECNQ